MSGTNYYMFQQHAAILKELKQQKIRKSWTCSSSTNSSSSSNFSSNSINSNSSVCNAVAVVNVVVTVHISSCLILSYEIRFVGLSQDVTNNYGSIKT
jgi:hypothetical protein